jgi:YihY family inner membrane protein
MATQAHSQQDASHDKQHSHNFLGQVNTTTKPLQTFIAKFNNDWSMNFSGMLAYSLLTAILPIAIALFGILGLVLGGPHNSVQESLMHQIPLLFPKSSQGAIIALLEGAIGQLQKDGKILLIIAILLALFGGSRLFISIEGCLDIIYRVRPRTIIRQNIMAFLMLLLFIVLVPIMFVASTAPAFILSFLNSQPQLKAIPFFSVFASSYFTTYSVGIFSSLLASFILFEAIYFIIPNQKISWNNSWRGAIVASILLVLFLQLFPFYTANFLKGYSGAIGLAVIILLFFYYFAVILMLGAEVNAFYFEHVQPLPNDLATFVSTMAGKLNKDRPEVESEQHVNPQSTNIKDHRHVVEESKHLTKDQQQQ